MLRRMRYQLFAQTLRFPLSHFRRTSQGEVIAMITGEAEPIGGFVGDSLVVPAFQGGTLLTILAFMFVQDWTLGLAAISLYPIQLYLIPKLQRQVNALSKERVRTVRRLSERIGEAVSSVEEIHSNDTSEWHRADFSRAALVRLRVCAGSLEATRFDSAFLEGCDLARANLAARGRRRRWSRRTSTARS